MEDIENLKEYTESYESDFFVILKSIVYSGIGIVIFFIPIALNGQMTTFLYHIAFEIQTEMNSLLKLSITIFTLLGCIKPFFDSRKNNFILNILKFMSFIILVDIFYGNKNIILISDNTILLIEELVLNTATVLPLAALFMTFLIDYGVLEIVESYFQKIMKKTYKLSGKTVVNIMIFLFTDCFCGYFIANNMYKKGKLRENEVVIIMVNFSIASIWIFNYVCNELDINKIDLILISLVMLTLVNVITCKIYPINKKKKSYFIKTNYKETIHKKDKFKKGMDKYIQNNCKKNIFKEIINNLEECFQILIDLIPNLVLVLFLGDLILNNGYIIELFNYIFTPVLSLLKLENLEVISEFIIMIFYNNIASIDGVITDITYTSKLMIGMITLIGCISLTSNMIYIKYTSISINIKELILLYIQRIVLILTLYCLISYAVVGYFM